jgi:hypothetical protein
MLIEVFSFDTKDFCVMHGNSTLSVTFSRHMTYASASMKWIFVGKVCALDHHHD